MAYAPKLEAAMAALRADPALDDAAVAARAGCSRRVAETARKVLVARGEIPPRRRWNKTPTARQILAAQRAQPDAGPAAIARQVGCSVAWASVVMSRTLRDGLLVMLALLALTTTTAAQPLHVDNTPTASGLSLTAMRSAQVDNTPHHELRPQPDASWWLLPHQAVPPIVRVVGGEGGAHCAEDGGACVVWAQGDWSLVEADGVWLAGRVYMPQVIR